MERELVGWIVVDQDGWVATPRAYGETVGEGAHTPRLLSRMEAENVAAKWRERWKRQYPDAEVQVCPVYAGPFAPPPVGMDVADLGIAGLDGSG